MKRRGLIQFLVFAVLFVALIVGCSVLLRSGGDGGGGEGGGGGGDGGEQTTMTFEQFQSVNLGVTQDEIEAEFGEPVPREQVIEVGVIPDDPSTENCIYYRADPPTFGEWFEFCFDGDVLSNKTSL